MLNKIGKYMSRNIELKLVDYHFMNYYKKLQLTHPLFHLIENTFKFEKSLNISIFYL
jgi:hypothetical protein